MRDARTGHDAGKNVVQKRNGASQQVSSKDSCNDATPRWDSTRQPRGVVCHRVILSRCVVLLLILAGVQYLFVKRLTSIQDQQPAVTTKTRAQRQRHSPKANTETRERFDGTTAITLEDLADVDHSVDLPSTTWKEAIIDRGPILDVLQRFGLNVTLPVLQRLPTWTQVVRLYGDQPVVWDPNESCASFRHGVDARHRYVGVAGQMNTGTNALSKYLTRNIYMEDHVDTKSRGVLWTVPWYKHGWAALRSQFRYHATPVNHSTVLAVVVIRDPYFWMQSMCASPYTLIWKKDKKHCPNLIESTSRTDEKVAAVSIRWSQNVTRTWPSLAHVWSSWYREYYKDNSPRLFIRFEDLLFHTESVVNSIRECVGASWMDTNEFQYIAGPAKTHPYFARFKPPTSLISAMIKYGQDDDGSFRRGKMTTQSQQFAARVLDSELIEKFHYQKL